MKPILHVVELNQISIFQQLQWEEALLRANDHNWCIINRGSPPAIVMGISGQVHQLIHQETFQRHPIPLIRRFSGGGTVIVNEDTLFITFICQANALAVSPFPRSLMQWTAELYQPLFPSSLSFKMQENDYAIGERKWGGNAQSIIKGRWLHHSSLLWNYNPEQMNYLLMPPTMPSYRQRRAHQDFLCCLSDYWPDSRLFQAQLLEQLSKQFVLVERERKEIEQVATLPHRKMTCLIKND